jgi:LCP family protein required for cell wall assembly
MNTSDLREQLNDEPTDGPLPVAAIVARARRIRRTRWMLGATAIIALAFVVSLVVRGPLAASSSQYPVAAGPSSTPTSGDSSSTTSSGAMNILLIGSDARGTTQGISDSLIVMHITADRKAVYLVSFPRDMYVTVPGYGKGKLSSGYTKGGPALAVSTIETLTGARMDHVAVTDFAGFVSLVDKVGPITVDNPIGSIAVSDRGVRYGFPKGPVVITDGYMALAFTRQRAELPQGDLDRERRQRAVVKAIALKLATPEVLTNPIRINDVIATVGSCVTVDSGMTNEVIYSLALSLTGITNAGQIHMLQAPITGFDTSPEGLSIDVVDGPGNAALGEALRNDTMAAFLAAHPTLE